MSTQRNDAERIQSLFDQAMDLLGGEGRIVEGVALGDVTLVVYEARGFRRWALQQEGVKGNYGGVLGNVVGDDE